jgi:hypothetical protein
VKNDKTKKTTKLIGLMLSILVLMIAFAATVSAQTYPSNGQIKWNGITFDVGSGYAKPGPNTWNSKGVYIDDQNRMHLTIQKVGSQWQASEIDTTGSYKYGVYRWTIESTDLALLDNNCILGLFAYYNDVNELDIEFSKWGNPSNDMLSYSCQPAQPSNFAHFPVTKQKSIVCQIDWQQSRIIYSAWYSDGTLIGQWTCTKGIPTVPLHLCMNLWMMNSGNGPTNGKPVDIVISKFEINPSGKPGVNTATFNPTADSYVQDGSYASKNYGKLTSLIAKSGATGSNRRDYLKFDFRKITASSVKQAKLRMYVTASDTSTSRNITVYGNSIENWSETGLTWKNAPANSTKIKTISVKGALKGKWIEFDVTSYINSNMKDKVVSLELINGGSNSISFYSREASAGYRPQLVITY